jgi:hypothetical protein
MNSVVGFLSQDHNEITAAAAILGPIVAIFVLVCHLRRARFQHGVDILLKLDE